MEHISSTIRKDKQMAFFSATWPKEVESLAYDLCTSGQPVTIRVLPKGKEDTDELVAREGIFQEVIMIEEFPSGKGMDKWGKQDEIKRRLLDERLRTWLNSWESKVLVFVNDKEFGSELANKLHAEGY